MCTMITTLKRMGQDGNFDLSIILKKIDMIQSQSFISIKVLNVYSLTHIKNLNSDIILTKTDFSNIFSEDIHTMKRKAVFLNLFIKKNVNP